MKTRLLICFFLLFSWTVYSQETDWHSIMSQRNEFYFKFKIDDVTELRKIAKIISVDNVEGDVVTAYANNKEFEKFSEMGYDIVLETPPSMLIEYDMFDGTREEYEWDSYPTYEAYESMMYDFASSHPDKCSIIELGTLSSGRKILLARINNGNPDGKPKFLYTSTIHGDECTGFIMMLRLIDYLLTSNDADVQNVVNNMDIFIGPNSNPDGTYHNGNHTVNGATRENGAGIDINRNFPDFNDGPHPDNKPYAEETELFMQLAEDYNFTMGANYHGGAEVLNYPWDTESDLHVDDAWWQHVCRQYADLVHEVDTNYMDDFNDGITNGYEWYSVSGGRQDYMNYYHGCREVTIECSDTKTPPAYQLPTYWNYNVNAIMAYLGQALNGIHGVVTDSITGAPLEATVTIAGHDEDYSKVSSHLPAGDYHRLIKGGTYTLTFTANGYYPKDYTVTVADNEAVNLDVKLVSGEGIIPDFTASNVNIGIGQEVSFTDASWGAGIVSWEWEFEGATPSTSNEQNPEGIKYNALGSYDVTLTVTNQAGDTESLTKRNFITVSEMYLMNNTTVTVNDAMFYDTGGADSDYGNNENMTMTFLPATEGSLLRVKFESFKTERDYDVLYIYDGTTTSATQIGSYSGSSSPGVLTATNDEGALTFRFTSDGSVTEYGWSAVVYCVGGEMNVIAGSESDTICEGETTRLYVDVTGGSGEYSYSWTPAASLDDAHSATPMANPSETTTYTVTVSDGNNEKDASVTVVVVSCQGVEEENANVVMIYPNPSSSNIYVKLNEKADAVWTLTNIHGQIVKRATINNDNFVVVSDGLTPGLYILNVKVGDHNIVRKIVVE